MPLSTALDVTLEQRTTQKKQSEPAWRVGTLRALREALVPYALSRSPPSVAT